MTDVNTDAPGAVKSGSPEALRQVAEHREHVRALEEQEARRREETDPAYALARIEFALQRIEALLEEKGRPRRTPLPFRIFRRR